MTDTNDKYDLLGRCAVVDSEIGLKDHRVHDIGAWRTDGATLHSGSKGDLLHFLEDVEYVCGHNIVEHDAKYLFSGEERQHWKLVDTLYLSPLLFPERPYHHLVKDDKLVSTQINNPVNDSLQARDLLIDEIAVWKALPLQKQRIYASLLHSHHCFTGFLDLVDAPVKASDEPNSADVARMIKDYYKGKICEHADVEHFVHTAPYCLAYALALIDTHDSRSVTPGWVLVNFPATEHVEEQLRHTRCQQGCDYCDSHLDIHKSLERYFGFTEFRTYEGEPLQELSVQAAVDGMSLLSIFPTGGGKSLTFQLPALMEGDSVHGLTVVISPLQSLMKDQVDNLAARGITQAVTINGLLDPISRADAIQRVSDGDASIIYIAPEMLRSRTLERLLLRRHVVRFVIDEAHCFSSWGHDFRVDYLYIGEFIKKYIDTKGCKTKIPVSCFTATAKQKVIQDICDYFKRTLDLNLEIFASTATRTNLRYSVVHVETDDDKYTRLRSLINECQCPTIVYVSRTRRTEEISQRLRRDGYTAMAFHGKMDPDQKIATQEAFMNGETQVIVATSAFGMGVDKSDVGLVVHFDISDSLENYVQEAGRAGRDPSLTAKCFVLYNDSDLDKHFILLNQTKLSISEIQQVWRAVKTLTKTRPQVQCSALEIAREAGWDDTVNDIETRVRTALATLEQGGYLQRGNNVPHVFATGITVKNMDEAHRRICASALFSDRDKEKAVRVIKSLISQKYIKKAQNAEAESRIDYLADILGMSKEEVVSVVERMRQEGILADSKDITAYLRDTGQSSRRAVSLLKYFTDLELFILESIDGTTLTLTYKQLNENAIRAGITNSKEKDLRTLLYFLTAKGYVAKKEQARNLEVSYRNDKASALHQHRIRAEVCRLAIEWLYTLLAQTPAEQTPSTQGQSSNDAKRQAVTFSEVEMLSWIAPKMAMYGIDEPIQLTHVEEALLFLSKIGAIKLEGGFLVLYNAMHIQRLKDMKSRYGKDDYRALNDFYQQKIQQVHIVGEYANLMVRDYQAALQYVSDYFQLDYKKFIAKYFKGERREEIHRNLTPAKYRQLFGQLSPTQKEIINDKQSRCIVVAAGPGSGKTMVLVHKLASLLLLEDVKHEQLLMLTFSRAAATEFKQRLISLIGNAAHFVEIKTFHGYCFDLLGRVGNLENTDDVVSRAAEMIRTGEVEPNRIGKTVLVVDEAQDIGPDEYSLIKALMERNEDMRVIAVGDDDQGIYEFRGSDSSNMYRLVDQTESRLIEMNENYRSTQSVVRFANRFAARITKRIKTAPIVSMHAETGYVGVTVHHCAYFYEPLIQEIKAKAGQGTIGVLALTNQEVLTIAALLHRHGVKCRLIHQLPDCRFYNLAEVRYLLKYLDSKCTASIIPDDVWERAITATRRAYAQSALLPLVLDCTEKFASTHRPKYLTDLKEYVFESAIENFSEGSDADVVVSTIHKAKGKEYDNVVLYVTARRDYSIDDHLRRALYVGITRAKKSLSVHTNSRYFDHLPADAFTVDPAVYGEPTEISLQLSLRDVDLSFFKDYKKEVLALRSGDEIVCKDHILFDKANRPLGRLSKSMKSTLNDWQSRGYQIESATARYIVAWKPKEAPRDEKEIAVVLPTLTLRRSN